MHRSKTITAPAPRSDQIRAEREQLEQSLSINYPFLCFWGKCNTPFASSLLVQIKSSQYPARRKKPIQLIYDPLYICRHICGVPRPFKAIYESERVISSGAEYNDLVKSSKRFLSSPVTDPVVGQLVHLELQLFPQRFL